jgi:hypothetical protein
MPKLLNTTYFITQSAPSSPSSDYISIFISSSAIFAKTSDGSITNLIGSKGYANIRIFSSSNANAWTKPADIAYIQVAVISPGAGGGGGALNAAGTNRFGGAGGNAGGVAIARFDSSFLTETIYGVSIASGGTGGAAATTSPQAGGVGGASGANTFFYASASNTTLLLARGSINGGGGGSTSTATVGAVITDYSAAPQGTRLPPFVFIGSTGTTSHANSIGYIGTRAGSGGAGGGSINSSNTSLAAGSSSIYYYGSITSSGSPGASTTGGSGGGPNNFIHPLFLFGYSGSATSSVYLGIGGHGGGTGNNSINSGGEGGSGSLGCGGGGGGAALFSAGLTSGRGGAGGDGAVVIFEYY